jgi:hypothetical protein
MLVLLLGIAFACGGKRTVGGKGGAKEPAKEAESGDDSPPGDPAMVREERLDLEFTVLEERDGYHQVTLIMIDETGSSSRTKVDEYPGECKRIALDASPGSGLSGEIMAAMCVEQSGQGRDLRFVVRQGQLVLLEARWDRKDAERSYEQRASFPLPSGAKIEAEPVVSE